MLLVVGVATAREDERLVSGLRGDGGVKVMAEGGVRRDVPAERVETPGQRLVRLMRGRGDAKETGHLSTDELMIVLFGHPGLLAASGLAAA